jgi:N-acetyl-anhydromuramyl-L-alanine amidase AmpD
MNIEVAHTHESNYGGENRGRKYIILHGTGKNPTATAAAEIKFLQRPHIGVSYHYYVTKAGAIVELVSPDERAWHAGASRWQSDSDLNDLSVGVGLESSNGFAEVYPAEQMIATADLCRVLMARYGIAADRILTHRDISDPQGRKIDPVNFDITAFRTMIKTQRRRVPLYSEGNRLLGHITLVDERKGYLPDEVAAMICAD